MAICVKCNKPCAEGRAQHYECPKPDMQPYSREDHDEDVAELQAIASRLNQLLTSNVDPDVFTDAWRAVLAGKLNLTDLQAWLYHVGCQTGHGAISGVEYKAMRNKLDRAIQKADTKLRMTAVMLREKPGKRSLSVADLRQRENK